MRWTSKLRLRLRSLLRSRNVEEDLTEELQYHLQHLVDDHVAAGMSATDARYAALREMGALEARKEECRDARGLRLIHALRSDLRYSVRQLRKYPVFTAAAVLTIAVGIGPNATMATVVSSVFRPLPVRVSRSSGLQSIARPTALLPARRASRMNPIDTLRYE